MITSFRITRELDHDYSIDVIPETKHPIGDGEYQGFGICADGIRKFWYVPLDIDSLFLVISDDVDNPGIQQMVDDGVAFTCWRGAEEESEYVYIDGNKVYIFADAHPALDMAGIEPGDEFVVWAEPDVS